MKALAFDYGASSGRAIIGRLNNGKLELEEIHRFSNDPVMLNGQLHWDFLRLFHEMKQGILLAWQKHGGADSIGVDTWGVDFGLLDEAGRLLSNPVHYRDARTDGMMEESYKTLPEEEQYKHSGLQFMQFNTLYQLLALAKENPRLLSAADKLLFMPDLFVYYLTGKTVAESSIASTSQMKVPGKNEWDASLLETFGLPAHILSPIVDSGTQAGMLSEDILKELSISGSAKVISVAQHDTASAVMAVPAEEKRFAYISSGTWSLLGTEADKPYINQQSFSESFTNEGGYNNTIRLLKNIMGLWIVQECRRQWIREGEQFSFSEMVNLAEDAPAFQAFIDPDDALFLPPHDMPARIVDFCRKTGQYVPKTKGEILRVVLESLALKYRTALTGMESILGYTLPVLHILGGGSQNQLLCRFTANAIARPVLAGPVEATAIGNLMCQFIALGEVANIEEARKIIANSFETVTYEAEDTAAWDEAYARFEKICKK